MSRKFPIVEGLGAVVVFLTLTACESVPEAQRGAGQQAPDGVDYIMAVQCSGLLLAMSVVESDSGQFRSMSGLHRQWAEARAREAGQDPKLAAQDIAASKDGFLTIAGGGPDMARRSTLLGAHQGEVRSCSSLAGAADFVVIGG